MTEISYIPRPRENHRLFGHASVEAVLHEACSAGRLHHSLLFSGPSGIGKSTLAYRLARYLLKPQEGGFLELDWPVADSFEISPEDPVFRQIAVGGHPALYTVERAQNPDTGKRARDITVGDIRGLSGFFRMTNGVGGWRVAIVDPADSMNLNAANALLKILEEPPKRSVIILISHAPGRLLPTIRSRCHVVQMSPPLPEALLAALEALDLSPSKEDLALLTELSRGSIGEAATLLQLDGVTMYQEIRRLLDRRNGGFDSELDVFADRLGRKGQEDAFELFCRLMLCAIGDKITSVAREGLIPQFGGELDSWLDVWEKVHDLLAQAAKLGLDRKHVVLNAFLHASSARTDAGIG